MKESTRRLECVRSAKRNVWVETILSSLWRCSLLFRQELWSRGAIAGVIVNRRGGWISARVFLRSAEFYQRFSKFTFCERGGFWPEDQSGLNKHCTSCHSCLPLSLPFPWVYMQICLFLIKILWKTKWQLQKTTIFKCFIHWFSQSHRTWLSQLTQYRTADVIPTQRAQIFWVRPTEP